MSWEFLTGLTNFVSVYNIHPYHLLKNSDRLNFMMVQGLLWSLQSVVMPIWSISYSLCIIYSPVFNFDSKYIHVPKLLIVPRYFGVVFYDCGQNLLAWNFLYGPYTRPQVIFKRYARERMLLIKANWMAQEDSYYTTHWIDCLYGSTIHFLLVKLKTVWLSYKDPLCQLIYLAHLRGKKNKNNLSNFSVWKVVTICAKFYAVQDGL